MALGEEAARAVAGERLPGSQMGLHHKLVAITRAAPASGLMEDCRHPLPRG